ncbi:MAG: aldehyde dehydrogenase family protein [Cytophagales bacterium]
MFQSINPYSGQEIFKKDFESDASVLMKLKYATTGFQTWKNLSFSQRAECIINISSEIKNRKGELAELISTEMGKSLRESLAEIEKCISSCEYYAQNTEVLLANHENHLSTEEYKIKIKAQGAVFGIMPWNFPFWQVFRYVIPNLMLGNVCLLKHAPNVGKCAEVIDEIINNHTPIGVFQHLWIDISQIELVIKSPIVIGTTLTGSEKAGSNLAALSGKHIKKSVLELGGSDAFIVDKTCNLEYAVEMAIKTRLQNNGQTCIAAKRFLIEESIFEAFKVELLHQLKLILTGNPFSNSYQYGLMARNDLVEKLLNQINSSISEGAILLNSLEHKPNNIAPVVLEATSIQQTCMQEELFGPVFVLHPFKNIEDLITIANSTNYGLAASIWSTNEEFCNKLIQNLEFGSIFINESPRSDMTVPFGGIKKSGYGRELSVLGLTEFANIVTVKLYQQ